MARNFDGRIQEFQLQPSDYAISYISSDRSDGNSTPSNIQMGEKGVATKTSYKQFFIIFSAPTNNK